MQITLQKTEWDAAASLGEKRQVLREARGKSDPEYNDGGGTHVKRNQIGAVAEYALAKALGPDILADWVTTKAYSTEHWKIKCDVGKNLHVRATDYKSGRLVLHPYDPEGGVFILAVVDHEKLTVTFRGWDVASNLKVPEYWDDYSNGFKNRPAFAVPPNVLNPMSTLPPEAIR